MNYIFNTKTVLIKLCSYVLRSLTKENRNIINRITIMSNKTHHTILGSNISSRIVINKKLIKTTDGTKIKKIRNLI